MKERDRQGYRVKERDRQGYRVKERDRQGYRVKERDRQTKRQTERDRRKQTEIYSMLSFRHSKKCAYDVKCDFLLRRKTVPRQKGHVNSWFQTDAGIYSVT